MDKKEMRFISEECFHLERPSELMLKECLQREKALLEEREDNLRSISQLSNKINRLKSSLEKMAKTTDIVDTADDFDDTRRTGLIYFIIDKDVQDRGKIGRTKNTNVNKLKTRYSTFGNPSILCFLSADIKSDENALKKLMRDAGCMETNKEMISNCDIARGVFYEFMTSRLS
jgi:replicative superfamily II helicase